MGDNIDDVEVARCVQDTKDLLDSSPELAVAAPRLHAATNSDLTLYSVSEIPTVQGPDQLESKCLGQGGLFWEMPEESTKALECIRRSGENGINPSFFVQLNKIGGCYAVSCQPLLEESASIVLFRLNFDWNCKIAPSGAAPPGGYSDNFGIDAGLTEELTECQRETEEITDNGVAGGLLAAKNSYAAQIITESVEGSTALSYPPSAVNTFQPFCEEFGGIMLPLSMQMRCTSLRTGSLLVTTYTNFYDCVGPNSCSSDLLACDLKQKAEAFQSSCVITRGPTCEGIGPPVLDLTVPTSVDASDSISRGLLFALIAIGTSVIILLTWALYKRSRRSRLPATKTCELGSIETTKDRFQEDAECLS